MSNTEQVNLNINIQLQSLRKAVSELSKVQNIVKNINITNNKHIEDSGVRNYYKGIGQNIKQQTVDLVDARGNIIKSVSRTSAPELVKPFNEQEWMKNFNSVAGHSKMLELRTTHIMDEELTKRAKRVEHFKNVESNIDAKYLKKAEADRQKLWGESAKMAFSLHIVQAYVQPFVQALKQGITEALVVFSEFEKYYADYVAKSSDFADVVGRNEIFSGAVGQTYNINEMADAMERFAASGIDITKNQQALTDVLQLATTASITYDESANSVIKTQEAFKLSINDSTMIVDALTNAANSSTAELKDLTEWFGYASGMAHETGINVQQLAAYLGILSSTGMKSAGTAMRQMLVQMTDTNVREKLNAVFGQEFDYLQMDQTILKMREFVQNSSNQAEVMQRISGALGGKVNAREALSRLLTADDATWSRIMTSTERSGTAAALFDKMTDNASANMQRIKNNIMIIVAQIGQIFEPLINIMLYVTNVLANLANNTPSFIKTLIGGFLLLSGAAAIVITTFASMVGLYYVLDAANTQFSGNNLAASFSVKQLAAQITRLSVTLVEHLLPVNAATAATARFGNANLSASKAVINSKYSMLSGAGAMVSYMGYQYAMEQQAYGLASALNLVTAAMTGIMLGGMIGGPLGAAIGGIAGLGVGYAGQSKIDRAKEESTLSRRKTAWYGKSDVTEYNDTSAKNYFTISTMNVNGVQDPNTLATELLYESDY